MEQEKARLRRDGHPNLIRELEASATLEIFFGQEHLDMAEQLDPIFRRKLAKDRYISCQDGMPRGRHGPET
jgi:hypothetical protein